MPLILTFMSVKTTNPNLPSYKLSPRNVTSLSIRTEYLIITAIDTPYWTSVQQAVTRVHWRYELDSSQNPLVTTWRWRVKFMPLWLYHEKEPWNPLNIILGGGLKVFEKGTRISCYHRYSNPGRLGAWSIRSADCAVPANDVINMKYRLNGTGWTDTRIGRWQKNCRFVAAVPPRREIIRKKRGGNFALMCSAISPPGRNLSRFLFMLEDNGNASLLLLSPRVIRCMPPPQTFESLVVTLHTNDLTVTLRLFFPPITFACSIRFSAQRLCPYTALTLIVLMWRIGWAHNNARK